MRLGPADAAVSWKEGPMPGSLIALDLQRHIIGEALVLLLAA